LDIGILWHIGEDFLPMRLHAVLKLFQSVEVEMPSTNEWWRRSRCTTGKPLIDLIADEAKAGQPILHQLHVFVEVIVEIKGFPLTTWIRYRNI
jgi:hypothetical protein